MLARKLPADDEDKHKEEVAVLLALFYRFVIDMAHHENEWDSLEDLMEARADFAIHHALDGFGIDIEEALKLINEAEDLTSEQQAQKTAIVAAIDNLADFAVVEEYQMADDMAEMEEALEPEEVEVMEDEDWQAYYLPVFSKFNDRYARTENMDIEYAMIMASYLSALRENTVLTYMTMGDERVRPWHLQYEGYSAPKSQFPSWLIPPIEHQCRCYLVEDPMPIVGSIQAAATPKMPEWFNRTFKESVALGGRIFSDEHPYFQVDERHVGRLNAITKRIKSKYLKDGAY